MITMGHERQRRDGGRKVLAAHDERDRRAGLGERALDIAHGDRRSEARAEAARRDRADDRAVARFDLGTFARAPPPPPPAPPPPGRRAPSRNSASTRSAPGNPPSSRRRFWIDQASPASTGEVLVSMSWP